ncbi:type III-B CRISPR module-associated Cmr3 family protein [Marinomonas mediterranea]|uniref:type III-B CRISPR module-associated Cmr3 family protein n=1 Tax=Marinomonas mediterranea TaxID=119864 RepID=UPI002349C71B|nr:type III-B CRISPR module-associated Cmr3 family protein [Marinomonas mediterranea]WCN08279.1 CRISPR-associated protein Cmr3 [Marinomonas mediterranea]
MTSSQTSNENTYLLDPKAPLIIRSGRPFDEQAGADEARFPPPSTMAGALRAAYARANNIGFEGNTQCILSKAIKGPLPVKQSVSGDTHTLLVPKPADAQYYYNNQGEKEIVRLSPRPLVADEGWDLPTSLLPVVFCEEQTKQHGKPESGPERGKPVSGPEWWSFDDLLTWRVDKPLEYESILRNGWTPPPGDIRTHVAINFETYAAEDGKLFQTSGLPMWQAREQTKTVFPEERILLAGKIDGNIFPNNESPTPIQALNLGGERRLAEISTENTLWPDIDSNTLSDLASAQYLSLTLLTPAIFENGWLPCNQGEDGRFIYSPPGSDNLQLELISAAVGRWKAQSGWDLANRRPKPSRKIAPAGSVYWFKVLAGDEHEIRQLWLTNISTSKRDRTDGFGLVLPHSTKQLASGA